MRIDLVMDGAWGSCGKGGIAGWLARRQGYDTVVCAYGTQAGHTYNDRSRNIRMMVQQLPVGVSGPTVKRIMIGPGALIHQATLEREIEAYLQPHQELYIHEHAAVVTDDHAQSEIQSGMSKLGSTTKGVGMAAVDRIMRRVDAVAKNGFRGTSLEKYVCDRFTYDRILGEGENILVEGAQGFGLSVYHGDYPWCTSRDVTPWQIAADCALPFEWASMIEVWMIMRTYPIRVNNRDGFSGPAYPGQLELSWSDLGKEPELTTVTKLPRRIFDFSLEQLRHAAFHCSSGNRFKTVLTFADYCTEERLNTILKQMASIDCYPELLGFGPDDSDIRVAAPVLI